MQLEKGIAQGISDAFQAIFSASVPADQIKLTPTRKDFEGTYTFVVFPYAALTKRKPADACQMLGEYLQRHNPDVASFNVVNGFLNVVISPLAWVRLLGSMQQDANYGKAASNGQRVMVEYSSPNTNKPLHLGHLRNNFLGHSLCNILSYAGFEVQKTNLVNDRGVHICKSMLAYQKFGKGETPASSGMKGDKLVGHYYVAFDKAYKGEIEALVGQYAQAAGADVLAERKALAGKEGLADDERARLKQLNDWYEKAEKEAPMMQGAQEMLRKWEQGDAETVALWKTMNGWVYEGFNETYKLMGVAFDKFYYESNTYLLGKDIVEEGLAKGVFFRKPDGSVWIDLSNEGLDQKLVLRADGTSVYMTQDMGTADLKYSDYPMNRSVYVVGNEQEYHFKVLKLIMQRLQRPYADGIYHLSYGMVDLPSGKMKSREGTVVDADDLIWDMVGTAQERTEALGKIDDFTAEEAQVLYKQLALGALKYYLLRVDPMKRMLFNPEESIDFQGNTGVYIQYNHAKISAITRKAQRDGLRYDEPTYGNLTELLPSEAEVVHFLSAFPQRVQEAAETYSPSVIANYAYDLSKAYSKFYSELSIFNEPNEARRAFRVALSEQTARVLREALDLLGIASPERM